MSSGFPSVTDQIAQVLRDGLERGRWKQTIPGRNRLSAELGVNHKTVKAALAILEAEGLIENQGPGRERRITGKVSVARTVLRVKILAYDTADLRSSILMEILHRLQSAGHLAGFAGQTIKGLGMDPGRVARHVAKADADAWVVVAGTKDILQWFAGRGTPAFAMFGRMLDAPMAGIAPLKHDALLELVDNLVGLGHRRIVMLSQEERRKPVPGQFERLFLARLESHGIRTGAYNLPDWGCSPGDLRSYIGTLFKHTPPTALIVDDTQLFLAMTQHLARLGIAAPERLSIACTDSSPAFEWCVPAVTHIAWNVTPVIKRVINWVDHVSRGKDDKRSTYTHAKLVPGGTIGPVPGGAR